jgi:hypothetical protein
MTSLKSFSTFVSENLTPPSKFKSPDEALMWAMRAVADFKKVLVSVQGSPQIGKLRPLARTFTDCIELPASDHDVEAHEHGTSNRLWNNAERDLNSALEAAKPIKKLANGMLAAEGKRVNESLDVCVKLVKATLKAITAAKK